MAKTALTNEEVGLDRIEACPDKDWHMIVTPEEAEIAIAGKR